MKTHFSYIFTLALIGGLMSCEDSPEKETQCSTHAIVEDWTELDGCGYLLRLDNDEYLDPIVKLWCGTPPLPEEAEDDPLRNFTLEAGMHVLIDYVIEEDMATICMKGTPISLTCIQEVEPQIGD